MDVRESMVKVYTVQDQPDYDNPWNMGGHKPKQRDNRVCLHLLFQKY